MCAEKFLLVSIGGRAECLACADPGARTPIGRCGNFLVYLSNILLRILKGVVGGKETRLLIMLQTIFAHTGQHQFEKGRLHNSKNINSIK